MVQHSASLAALLVWVWALSYLRSHRDLNLWRPLLCLIEIGVVWLCAPGVIDLIRSALLYDPSGRTWLGWLLTFVGMCLVPLTAAFCLGSILLVTQEFDPKTGRLILPERGPLYDCIELVSSSRQVAQMNFCQLSWLLVPASLVGLIVGAVLVIVAVSYLLAYALVGGGNPAGVLRDLIDHKQMPWTWHTFRLGKTTLPRMPLVWTGLLALPFRLPHWLFACDMAVLSAMALVGLILLYVAWEERRPYVPTEERVTPLSSLWQHLKGGICPRVTVGKDRL